MSEIRWLSLNDICLYLGIGRDMTFDWIKHKGMPSCRVGKFLKFKKKDVDEWVRSGSAFDNSNKKGEITKMNVISLFSGCGGFFIDRSR